MRWPRRDERQQAYAALKDAPAVTRDDVDVCLQLNAGLVIDLHQLSVTGASGVGPLSDGNSVHGAAELS